MAAKKAAASKSSTVTQQQDAPELSSELEAARDAQLKAEQDRGLKDERGGLIVAEVEVTIDPELEKARQEALKAEKDRPTFGSL